MQGLHNTPARSAHLGRAAKGGVLCAAPLDDVPQQRLLAVVGGEDGDLVGGVAQQPHVLQVEEVGGRKAHVRSGWVRGGAQCLQEGKLAVLRAGGWPGHLINQPLPGCYQKDKHAITAQRTWYTLTRYSASPRFCTPQQRWGECLLASRLGTACEVQLGWLHQLAARQKLASCREAVPSTLHRIAHRLATPSPPYSSPTSNAYLVEVGQGRGLAAALVVGHVDELEVERKACRGGSGRVGGSSPTGWWQKGSSKGGFRVS